MKFSDFYSKVVDLIHKSYITYMSHRMYRLLVSIVSPPFKHLLPCYVEDVIMAMVKATTPPRQLWELSYDLGVVDYMEIEELEKMHDCKSRDNT